MRPGYAIRAVLAWGLVLAAGPAAPAGGPAAPGTIAFRSATHEGDLVFFDAPAPIDWAGLARRHVGVIDPGHPTLEQLATLQAIRNDFGHAEVGYDAPVDPRLAAGTYYLLHGTGVTPLRLLRLRGTVRYAWAPDGQSILEVVHFGQVVARRDGPGPSPGGGFVLVAPAPLALKTAPLGQAGRAPSFTVRAPRERGEAVYTFTDRTGRVLALRQTLEHPAAIRSSYLLTLPSGGRYAVVRWTADPDCAYGCCEFSYSLFELAATMREVVWSRYGCDV